MTYDFFMGQLRLIAVALIAYGAGAHWFSTETSGLFGSLLTPVGLIAGPWIWSLYRNVNMKLVPKDSVAISSDHVVAGPAVTGSTVVLQQDVAKMAGQSAAIAAKVVGCLALFVLFAPQVFAADLAVKPSLSSWGSACTPTACSGFYVGGQLGGAGSNADVIGNGINGSVFAGGGILAIDAGYQYAVGNWFAGVEAGAGYQFATGATVQGVQGNGSGFLAYQIVKAGGNLGALLGTPGAISIPPKLADSLISPYVLTGAVERSFATGWASGAGATFDISPKLFLDTKYMYVNYGPSSKGAFQLSNENLLLLGLNYKF